MDASRHAASDLRAGAEPLDGPAISWARAIARELGIDLVAGSIAERVDGERRSCATPRVHVGPDGEIAAAYRKIHLFDVEVDGRRLPRVRRTRTPGDEPVAHARPPTASSSGLTVCYDLRFPELYRDARASRGARVLTVPAAFTVPTTRDHWEVLLRARAIENQCFVIAANQIGEHAAGHRVRRALDDRRPVGRRARAARPTTEAVIAADLDLDAQDAIRGGCRRSPTAAPAAYRWPQRGAPPDGHRATPSPPPTSAA